MSVRPILRMGDPRLLRVAEPVRAFDTPDRDRALFERDDQGQDGPHMLNRSFSGTY